MMSPFMQPITIAAPQRVLAILIKAGLGNGGPTNTRASTPIQPNRHIYAMLNHSLATEPGHDPNLAPYPQP